MRPSFGNELDPTRPRLAFFERRYVVHCRNIDHEDFGMMGQIKVGRSG